MDPVFVDPQPPQRRGKLAARGWALGITAASVAALAFWANSAFVYADPAADEDPQCNVAELPGPGDNAGGIVIDLSSSGEYAIGQSDSQAALWKNGKFTPIGEDAFGYSPDEETDHRLEVTGVNSNGEVVGTQEDPDTGNTTAWKYSHKKVTELKAPKKYEGESVTTEAINDDGDVIGNTWKVSDMEPEVPLKWDGKSSSADETEKSKAPRAEELKLGKKMLGRAYDINDKGQVVGSQRGQGDDSTLAPWIWQADGTDRELPAASGQTFAHATAINGDWILSDDNSSHKTYMWNTADLDTPKKLKLDTATAVDSQGRVYGAVDTEHAGTQYGNKVSKLPALDGPDENDGKDNLHEVLAVSDDGKTLVGNSTNKDDLSINAQWACK